jgi:molybdopterin synthase catalytic subunit
MDRTPPQIEVQILDQPIDPAAYRKTVPDLKGCGGYVSFEGLVRNINHGKKVTRLEYETYDELALKELGRICEFAAERHKLEFVRAIHRKGRLEINDVAVIIQVLSRHRKEAFDGCRLVIDSLKRSVPIWKKEFYEDGTHTWTQCHDHAHEPSLLDG